MALSHEQQIVFDKAVRDRESLFYSGSAGTGKSHLLREIVSAMQEQGRRVHVTSSTGISACNVSGITLHRYAGAALARGDAASCIAMVRNRRDARIRWCKTDVLFVDEVSMVDAKFFDKVDAIARSVRGKLSRPFGGIQVILCGDFAQLPPVGSKKYCFETDAWKDLIGDRVYLLTVPYRQSADSGQLSRVLDLVRFGIVDDEVREVLSSRAIAPPKRADNAIVPTRLYSLRKEAATENENQLGLLPGEEYTYHASDTGTPSYRENLDRNCQAPSILKLKVGAQVILLYNMDVEAGLANGSRGVVTSMQKGSNIPVVRFANGRVRPIGRWTWSIESPPGTTVASRTQYPLVLAWAITIHKCVSGDTLIHCDTRTAPIRSLADKDGWHVKKIMVWTKSGIEPTSGVFRGEEEESIIVETSLGYKIEGSVRHPLLVRTVDGNEAWKILPDIVVGDTVVLQAAPLPHLAPTDDEAYSLGEILGNEMHCAASLCPDMDMSHRTTPELILQADLLSQNSFIKGLFDSSCGDINERCISLTLCSRRFAEQVHVMLLAQSVVSRLYEPSAGTFRIDITGNNMLVFTAVIFSKRPEKMKQLPLYDVSNHDLDMLLQDDVSAYPDSCEIAKEIWSTVMPGDDVTHKVAQHVTDCIDGTKSIHTSLILLLFKTFPRFRQGRTALKLIMDNANRVLFDKVKSIGRSSCRMFDLEVPGSHSFVGNGFVNHNSQGMGIDSLYVSLKSVFAPGQAYVALSRATSLDGLYIAGLDYNKIKCDEKVKEFYERYRA